MSANESKMPDNFDRALGMLDGLPDVCRTRESTMRVTPPLGVGGSQTWIVQTVRQREQGDTIFLEHASVDGLVRLVIPPKVADTIARQREQLTGMSRRKATKRVAQDRKDRGIQTWIL